MRRLIRKVPVFLWALFWQTLYQLVVIVDRIANVLIGGDEGETISSRLGKGRNAGKPGHTVMANVVDVIFWAVFRDKDHCENSIVWIVHRHERSVSALIDRIFRGKGYQYQRPRYDNGKLEGHIE